LFGIVFAGKKKKRDRIKKRYKKERKEKNVRESTEQIFIVFY